MQIRDSGVFDVVVMGGGILGSSVAYHLLSQSPGLSVAVIEPDPTYEFASAPRASGGCRVQFTCPENIALSLASLEFIRDFPTVMATRDHPAPVDWVEGGYLFIVPPGQTALLERNVARQRSRGCVVDLLTPSELRSRFPSMNVSDLGAGAFTPHDGWCDPSSLLWGFRRKAIELGARYVADRIESAEFDRIKVRSVGLASGARIGASALPPAVS